ncbi:MAG: flagellin [Limimaricola soesokkakensis]|uniref:flagellin n=1 Tax=Limimaricola soesokkakensis TaxID=1343159 RepID=UPI004057D3C0
MSLTSLGDGSRHFLMRNQGVALRHRLDGLVSALSSGRAADPVAAMGRDATRLATTRSAHGATEAYGRVAAETGQRLALMQTALGELDGLREALAGQLVLVGETSADGVLSNMGRSAEQGFEAVVSALNRRMGGTALFAGRDGDATALAPPGEMLDAIRATLPPQPGAEALRVAVSDWFDLPGGGFESAGYLGDAEGHATPRIGAGETVALAARADDPAPRMVMKALALATLAGEAEAMGGAARGALIREAGTMLLSAGSGMTESRAALGAAEATVEATSARHAARATALGLMQNQMIAADPYATATALQEVQTQLETHYMLTARLSELSLTRYLR